MPLPMTILSGSGVPMQTSHGCLNDLVATMRVFDQQEQIYKGGDGVEVHFMVQQNGEQRIIQQLNLNLHVHPEQRRWRAVQLSLASDIQNLTVEALPGPPGSNNWYDRVWVSAGEDTTYIMSLAMMEDQRVQDSGVLGKEM